MIEAILAVAMPFAVKYSTSIVKNIGPIPMLSYRVLIIRAVVAILSLSGAILTVVVGDLPEGSIDPGLVETVVFTTINASVATWLYFKSKK